MEQYSIEISSRYRDTTCKTVSTWGGNGICSGNNSTKFLFIEYRYLHASSSLQFTLIKMMLCRSHIPKEKVTTAGFKSIPIVVPLCLMPSIDSKTIFDFPKK